MSGAWKRIAGVSAAPAAWAIVTQLGLQIVGLGPVEQSLPPDEGRRALKGPDLVQAPGVAAVGEVAGFAIGRRQMIGGAVGGDAVDEFGDRHDHTK